jgi:hypothetical protein
VPIVSSPAGACVCVKLASWMEYLDSCTAPLCYLGVCKSSQSAVETGRGQIRRQIDWRHLSVWVAAVHETNQQVGEGQLRLHTLDPEHHQQCTHTRGAQLHTLPEITGSLASRKIVPQQPLYYSGSATAASPATGSISNWRQWDPCLAAQRPLKQINQSPSARRHCKAGVHKMVMATLRPAQP